MSRKSDPLRLGFHNIQSHHGIIIVIIYGALVGGLLACTSAQPEHTRDAFTRAEAAFFANDFRAAERAYSEAQVSDSGSEHQLIAALTRATIAWRVRDDTTTARQRVLEAAALHFKTAQVDMERSRMLAFVGDQAGARAAARQAVAEAEDATERVRATDRLASVIVAEALHIRLDNDVMDSSDTRALREVEDRLTPIVVAAPGLPSAAHELVTAAALLGDGPTLLDAWRSYYLVGTNDTANGPLAAPRRILAALLPGWHGHGSPADNAALVRALAGSAFVEEAAAVALYPGVKTTLVAHDAYVAEIVAYARWVRKVRRLTDEYYRQVALGAGDAKVWLSSLEDVGRELWPQLDWGRNAPPPYRWDHLMVELGRRFGTVGKIDETAGTKDLHMGHRVVEELRTVRQYDHEAEVRFVAIDGMVSNGYQTWAWDGRSQHGGWAEESLIVQVRAPYAANAIDAWRAVMDTAAARHIAETIAWDSTEDWARSRLTPVAYFPSVVKRMRRGALAELVDSLRSAGVSGKSLQAAFVQEYARISRESSIFAHEGRHAIEKKMGVLGGGLWGILSGRWWSDREFRAKLSEVVFAPHPRLALDAIILPNIGDGTPHGQGNLKIMEGIVAWMQAHEGEIHGLLKSDPFLPQLPLLSDRQLRAAFASMDPLREQTPDTASDTNAAPAR